MLNGRKCKALVGVFAARLVVDAVFVKFSCEVCNNAELMGRPILNVVQHAEVKRFKLKH